MIVLFFVIFWILGLVGGCEIMGWVLTSMSHEDFMYVLDVLTRKRIAKARSGKIEKENYLKKRK